MRVKVKQINIGDYDKLGKNTYKLKGEHPVDRYTTNDGQPIWINHRVYGWFGYIDDNGIEWKVNFINKIKCIGCGKEEKEENCYTNCGGEKDINLCRDCFT